MEIVLVKRIVPPEGETWTHEECVSVFRQYVDLQPQLSFIANKYNVKMTNRRNDYDDLSCALTKSFDDIGNLVSASQRIGAFLYKHGVSFETTCGKDISIAVNHLNEWRKNERN